MVEEHVGRLLRQVKSQQAQIDSLRDEFDEVQRFGKANADDLAAAIGECLESSRVLRKGQFAACLHRRRFEGLLRKHPPDDGWGVSLADLARVPGVIHPILCFAGVHAIRCFAAAGRLLHSSAEVPWQYTMRPPKLYVLGGSSQAPHEPLRSVLRFDVAYGTWEQLPPMPTARDVFAAAAVDGKIYAVGGSDGRQALAVAERIDTDMDGGWETLQPMWTGRGGLAVCVAAGRIYAVGGSDGTRALGAVEWYDVNKECWQLGPALPTPRRGIALVAAEWDKGHCLYAIGGSDGGAAMNAVERLVVEVQCEQSASTTFDYGWEAVPPMPTARRAAAAAVLGGKAYVVGGAGGIGLSDPSVNIAECLNLADHTWESLPAMPSARRGLALVVVGEHLYALGGSDGSQTMDAVEVFSVNHGTWMIAPPMPERRAYFGAATTRTLEVLGITRGKALAEAMRTVST